MSQGEVIPDFFDGWYRIHQRIDDGLCEAQSLIKMVKASNSQISHKDMDCRHESLVRLVSVITAAAIFVVGVITGREKVCNARFVAFVKQNERAQEKDM